MSRFTTQFEAIAKDDEVTKEDLVSIVEMANELGIEQAVEDFYNDNGYPVLKDEDEAYMIEKDK